MLASSAASDEVDAGAIPIYGVTTKSVTAIVASLDSVGAAFVKACGYEGASGQILVVPGPAGEIACVLFGVGNAAGRRPDPFLAGKLATALPEGPYRLAEGFEDPFLAALGFALGAYRFTRFRAVGSDVLEAAARALAERFRPRLDVVTGDDLIARNFPMIHAVGRAAAEAPRLVDFSWGDEAAPKVTLVGKGVCFDTGEVQMARCLFGLLTERYGCAP